jgi:hypothetical protein
LAISILRGEGVACGSSSKTSKHKGNDSQRSKNRHFHSAALRTTKDTISARALVTAASPHTAQAGTHVSMATASLSNALMSSHMACAFVATRLDKKVWPTLASPRLSAMSRASWSRLIAFWAHAKK